MKLVKTTKEEEIKFAYDGKTKLVINKEGLLVEDSVAQVLSERLGSLISIDSVEVGVDLSVSPGKTDEIETLSPIATTGEVLENVPVTETVSSETSIN